MKKEGGKRSGVSLEKKEAGCSFSHRDEEGVNPGEKTQGRWTADPTAAYTLVSSVGGWIMP